MSAIDPTEPERINSSLDWPSLIDQAITRTRGLSSIPVKGARLRKALEELLAERGCNLNDVLRQEHLTFSRFLTLRDPSLKVIKQQGTDMLVAKSQEELSSSALDSKASQHSFSIRSDFYSALMDFSSDHSWYYDVNKDRAERVKGSIHPDKVGELILLPQTSQDEQIALRQAFLDQYKISPLQTMLSDKGNFMRTFMNHVYGVGLAQQWHEFKFSALKAKLLQWAAEHQMEVKQDWFGRVSHKNETTPDMVYFLKQISRYLTEEELRNLKLPLRAVYEFWLAQRRQRAI